MAKKTNPSQSKSAEQLAQKTGMTPALLAQELRAAPDAPTLQEALGLAAKVLAKKKKALDDANAEAAQDADQHQQVARRRDQHVAGV